MEALPRRCAVGVGSVVSVDINPVPVRVPAVVAPVGHDDDEGKRADDGLQRGVVGVGVLPPVVGAPAVAVEEIQHLVVDAGVGRIAVPGREEDVDRHGRAAHGGRRHRPPVQVGVGGAVGRRHLDGRGNTAYRPRRPGQAQG